MTAVAYRLRCVLRSRWRATLGMTLIVAAVSAVVLTFAAGAQRTSSAPDRYTAAHGSAPDGVIMQERGSPRTDEVAALPAAMAVESVTFVFAGLSRPDATGEPLDATIFGGNLLAVGAQLVDGREPNAAARNEFVVTKSFADLHHVAIGDTFVFLSFTQEQANRAGFGAGTPEGPTFDDAVLVGIVDGPADGDPSADLEPLVVFPSSLLDEADLGLAATVMSVTLRSGVDLDSFRTQLDELPDSDVFLLRPAPLVSEPVRTAVEAQSRGLWLLAAVSAIAAVAVLGQLITRQVRLTAADRSRLSAIGFTDAQIVMESVGRAAVPIVVGTLLAIGLATCASGIFPTGFVRRIDPTSGVRFEAVVLLAGAAGLLLALLSWSAIALGLTRVRSGAARPSAVIEGIATKSPSATAATGLRFAFARGERDVGSTRTAVAGLLMTVIGVVGAFTFASSLERLVDERPRYGYLYDVAFGLGETAISDEMRDALDSDPDVAALMLLAEGQSRVGSESLSVIGMDQIRGEIAPPVLEGRLPASEDEVAFGRLTANNLGLHVGDEVTLEGSIETRIFRVVGLAVIPSVGSNEGVGQDALVTMRALERLDSSVAAASAAIKVRPDAPAGALERLTETYSPDSGGGEGPPGVIQNVARVRAIPYLLAALLGALAVLTLAHVMLTSMHNRRRDVAVMRSLGADRGWITRAVHWQATAFTLLPLVIGTPIGLIAGQLVFRSFADKIGVVNGASLPFVLVTAIVVALVLIANAVAAVPARRARRMAPALLLQSE